MKILSLFALFISFNLIAVELPNPSPTPIDLPEKSPSLVIESPPQKIKKVNADEERFKQNRGQQHLKTYDSWKNGPAHPNDGNVP